MEILSQRSVGPSVSTLFGLVEISKSVELSERLTGGLASVLLDVSALGNEGVLGLLLGDVRGETTLGSSPELGGGARGSAGGNALRKHGGGCCTLSAERGLGR